MRRYFTYKYILLFGTLFLSGGVYLLGPKQNQTASYETTLSQYLSATPSIEPTPAMNSLDAPNTIYVRNSALLLGEREESLLRKLGSPGRIDATEYDFTYYIYNNDYKKLLFVAIKDNIVVGFYSDSPDFRFEGISYGDSFDQVNHALDEDFSIAEVLTHSTSTYTINILMDKLDAQTVTGIYVLADVVKDEAYSDPIMKNLELMVYDLTNSVRVRNGLSALSWSSSLAKAARKHSVDMAANDFFSHIDPARRSAGDRIVAEGIAYQKCGENIIAGYGSAILSTHAWFNSESHRKNMLHPDYRYLGVGFCYDDDSIYKDYFTQNFYR